MILWYSIFMEQYQSQSFRLFKQMPSFVDGFASLINLAPSESKYNYDKTTEEADLNSLRADWFAIGQDLWEAIKKYEREQQTARI